MRSNNCLLLLLQNQPSWWVWCERCQNELWTQRPRPALKAAAPHTMRILTSPINISVRATERERERERTLAGCGKLLLEITHTAKAIRTKASRTVCLPSASAGCVTARRPPGQSAEIYFQYHWRKGVLFDCSFDVSRPITNIGPWLGAICTHHARGRRREVKKRRTGSVSGLNVGRAVARSWIQIKSQSKDFHLQQSALFLGHKSSVHYKEWIGLGCF